MLRLPQHGGLLVKEMLRHATTVTSTYKYICDSTKGIVFFATPHTGSSISDIASYLRFVLRQTVAVDQLAANQTNLRDLNLWFRNNFSGIGIKTRIVFETQKTHGLRVVSEASADPGIPNISPIPIDADHLEIICPRSYRAIVVGQTLKLIDDAIPSQAHKFSPDRPIAEVGPDRPDPRRVAGKTNNPTYEERTLLRLVRKRELILASAGVGATFLAFQTWQLFHRLPPIPPDPIPTGLAPTSSLPPWLATMRRITGTHTSGSNPAILAWAKKIGELYPDMATYCAGYTNDAIGWSGLAVAYCMAVNGIRPVFGATDTDRFLYAQAWGQFGEAVDATQAGDVLVFDFGGGDHHVTLFEQANDDSYICRGGNQDNQVKASTYARTQCTAIRRPPATALRQANIFADIFGGASDCNTSPYDGHLIDDTELGVALPYRFSGARPNVRVWQKDKSVVCTIVGVGPWNTDDPYWQTGTRPQAESGVDRRGRLTDRAGIDLTPAAAHAIGLSSKGIVDWEFA
jgi:hypothetical protein